MTEIALQIKCQTILGWLVLHSCTPGRLHSWSPACPLASVGSVATACRLRPAARSVGASRVASGLAAGCRAPGGAAVRGGGQACADTRARRRQPLARRLVGRRAAQGSPSSSNADCLCSWSTRRQRLAAGLHKPVALISYWADLRYCPGNTGPYWALRPWLYSLYFTFTTCLHAVALVAEYRRECMKRRATVRDRWAPAAPRGRKKKPSNESRNLHS